MKYKLAIIFSILISATNSAGIFTPPSVWDVMRNQFQLSHEVSQPEVQAQMRWLIAHPGYLQKLSQSKPYIYHIVSEVRRRGLPGELALIPMIESAYDPFAYSGVGAAGLWQLMPGTGTGLGLKQDWWFDARRSVRPSTDAALNYLTYLNKYFNGNWILAIAAYDAGEGTISRAIKNSGQSKRNISFWTLPVPNETKAYIPRLLALAEIIKYSKHYNINLPSIPHTPYFEEVNIGSQIDLNHAAKLAGISYSDLIKLNPGYNRWTTAPYQPFKLLIPTNKVANFNNNLANVPKEMRVSFTKHIVKKGDSLSSIAKRYFTTVKLLHELNQLRSVLLTEGQTILIPSSKNTTINTIPKPSSPILVEKSSSIQNYKVLHIVQKGDNYPQLAKKYHVSAENIRAWNNLPELAELNVGQQLIIWQRKNFSAM